MLLIIHLRKAYRTVCYTKNWKLIHSFIRYLTNVYPLPYRFLYVTHATRALQSKTCKGRELTLDHIHNIFTTQGHGEPLRMREQFNDGTSSEHERRYTPSTHPLILTRRIWEDNYYDGQMIFGNLVGLKLPDICLKGEENPEITSPRKLVPPKSVLLIRNSRPTSFKFLLTTIHWWSIKKSL